MCDKMTNICECVCKENNNYFFFKLHLLSATVQSFNNLNKNVQSVNKDNSITWHFPH